MGCCSSAPVVNPTTNKPSTASGISNPDPYPVALPPSNEIKKPSQLVDSAPNPKPAPKPNATHQFSDVLSNKPAEDIPVPDSEKEIKPDNNFTNDLISTIKDEVEEDNNRIPDNDISPSKENKISDDEQVSEILNNNIKEICAEGHTLKYRMDLVYFFMMSRELQSDSPIHIPCSQCSRIFSSPGWECQVCNSILCDSCGSNSCEKNVLKCKRDHKLTWCVDSWAFNIETNKSTKSLVTCNVCHKLYQEPAYTCRACLYYSCISCSHKNGVSPPVNLLTCPNDHQLTLQPGKDVRNPCGKCERAITGNCYKCQDCGYAMCNLCGIKNTLKMVRHPGLRCTRSEPTMTLNDFRNMPNKNSFRCKGCYKGGIKFGMFCVYCGETFCLDCADLIQQHLEEDIGKTSNKGSTIQWYGLTKIEADEKFKCLCCEEDKSGIYLYDENNEKFCLECTTTFN